MRWLVCAALVVSAAGCGGGHPAGGAPTMTLGPLKRAKADKLAAIVATRKRAAAAGTRNFIPLRSPCARGSFPTWSPDGTHIAWAGGGAICVARADGSRARAIKATRGLVDSPFQLDWVRRGLILYGDNYVVREIRQRAQSPTPHWAVEAPAFAVSADGSRFSTATRSDCPRCTGPAHLWTMDGKPVGTIGDSKQYYDPPSLSPNGSSVVFARDGAIWTASADGSHARRLVSNATAPLWSPADGQIAYTTSGGLWVVDAKGEKGRLVARQVGDNAGWSPDGKLIASWGIGRVVVVDVATGTVRELPFVGYPAPGFQNSWSPDSKELLVTARLSGRCFDLWRQPADGSKPRLVSSCY